MNHYTTLVTIKSLLGIDPSNTDSDQTLTDQIEQASRACELPTVCNRHFYVRTGSRTILPESTDCVILPDLLSVTSIGQDSDMDGGVDIEWDDADYFLEPFSRFPKLLLKTKPLGLNSISVWQPFIIVGDWGYGDGQSADPWESLGVAFTLATAAATTATLSAVGGLVAGMTVKVGSEQMFIVSVSPTGATIQATVKRGVNGTTAAAHTAADGSMALYPAELVSEINRTVGRLFQTRRASHLTSRRLGQSSFTYQKGSGAAGASLFSDTEISALKALSRTWF